MKKDKGSPVVVVEQTEASSLDVLLDEHEVRSEPRGHEPSPGPACVMGHCIDDRHPTLLGRVRVRWSFEGREQERWLPTLQGLVVRTDDRVMMLRPEGSDELVVTGVIDGFARRPTPDKASAATIELKRDEAVRVVGADGTPLLELHEGESGPVVTVLHEDLELATPGRLRLRGKQVEVKAEQGRFEVEATDDVIIRGEIIKLN